METEKCDKCGVEVEKGTLIRNSVDASQLLCRKCSKKPRKPRKKKESPAAGLTLIDVLEAKFLENPPPPIDPLTLQKDVEKWAGECGLGKIRAAGPTREDYPRFGYGYSFQIQEISGKERKASARYTCLGQRSFWTIDGIVTG